MVSETTADPAIDPPRPQVNPWLPCFLAWLLPGSGHLYLGKRVRAIAFFVVVLASFTLGIFSDGTASVIDSRQPLSYLATFDNLAIGPLDLLSRHRTYGEIVFRMPDNQADPHRLQMIGRLRDRVRSVTYEYGNTFLLTAGLMNILLILDVFDIATGRKD